MRNPINLGLRRDIVELFDHSVLWEKYANETIIELKNIFGHTAIDIQHIGSTAIKNIKAKPIIDIVVGINELKELGVFVEKLEQNNYVYRPFKEDDVIFIKGNIREETRTHHIHVVKHNSDVWNNQINFRDYLNNNETDAKNYEKLKVKLQKDNRNNRSGYTEKKEGYIIKIIEKAQEWKRSQIRI
ncbi:GrpB family protein [Flavobacterium oncorhynchi]|uniref:GrpB family protein n=1 Tax=Flavobacterium oncorhynchi TaxID=728056 RepID=UPI00351A5861